MEHAGHTFIGELQQIGLVIWLIMTSPYAQALYWILGSLTCAYLLGSMSPEEGR